MCLLEVALKLQRGPSGAVDGPARRVKWTFSRPPTCTRVIEQAPIDFHLLQVLGSQLERCRPQHSFPPAMRCGGHMYACRAAKALVAAHGGFVLVCRLQPAMWGKRSRR